LPIYEYRCERCHHTFEVIQKLSDEPIKRCVLCQGLVQKVLSPPGLLFKGKGWYVTDYPSHERKKAMKSEESTSDSGSQAEVKKTTQPEDGNP